MQGWEIAQWFFKRIPFFFELKSKTLVKKRKSLLSLFCHKRQERIPHGRSFVKSDRSDLLTVSLLSRPTRANRSRCSIKKSNGIDLLLGIKRGKAVKNCQKHKNKNFFERIARFWERFAWIMSKSLISLFFLERREWLSHSRSFVMNGLSELLTVALLLRATRAIH